MKARTLSLHPFRQHLRLLVSINKVSPRAKPRARIRLKIEKKARILSKIMILRGEMGHGHYISTGPRGPCKLSPGLRGWSIVIRNLCAPIGSKISVRVPVPAQVLVRQLHNAEASQSATASAPRSLIEALVLVLVLAWSTRLLLEEYLPTSYLLFRRD